MSFSGQTDELSPNKNEGNHGRHDAHKHHDTMGEIVQGQEFPNNVKNSSVDSTSPNKDETLHGRHDAHKHHDTMGEIVQAQGQGLLDNVKNNHVDLVENHVKEVNPHSESLDTHQIDKYGNCVERDLKYHHSST